MCQLFSKHIPPFIHLMYVKHVNIVCNHECKTCRMNSRYLKKGKVLLSYIANNANYGLTGYRQT